MNRGARTVLVLVVALVAAAAASYGAFQVMQRVSAQQQRPETMPLVVAARDVPMGTLLTKDHVRVVSWPTMAPVQGGFAKLEDVLDRGTVTALVLNEPVIEGKLATKGIGAGLSPTIPPGMRAISIRVNEVIGVAGFVVPGSRVDVLVTLTPTSQGDVKITRMVTGNVSVLTAGSRIDQDLARADGKPIPTSVVTLMVTPDDAERIALAQNEGQITLTLRNPLDQAPVATTGVRLTTLLGQQTNVVTQTSAPRARPIVVVTAPPPAAPKPYTVEAYRGSKRSEETIK